MDSPPRPAGGSVQAPPATDASGAGSNLSSPLSSVPSSPLSPVPSNLSISPPRSESVGDSSGDTGGAVVGATGDPAESDFGTPSENGWGSEHSIAHGSGPGSDPDSDFGSDFGTVYYSDSDASSGSDWGIEFGTYTDSPSDTDGGGEPGNSSGPSGHDAVTVPGNNQSNGTGNGPVGAFGIDPDSAFRNGSNSSPIPAMSVSWDDANEATGSNDGLEFTEEWEVAGVPIGWGGAQEATGWGGQFDDLRSNDSSASSVAEASITFTAAMLAVSDIYAFFDGVAVPDNRFLHRATNEQYDFIMAHPETIPITTLEEAEALDDPEVSFATRAELREIAGRVADSELFSDNAHRIWLIQNSQYRKDAIIDEATLPEQYRRQAARMANLDRIALDVHSQDPTWMEARRSFRQRAELRAVTQQAGYGMYLPGVPDRLRMRPRITRYHWRRPRGWGP